MNNKLLLFAIAVVTFSSCSTVYKSGQTPDDVYFSPVRLYDDGNKEDKDNREDNRRDYSEERQIRLGISDPRWRNFDNDISYNPYLYGYNYGYYYNPYYCPLPVYNSVIVVAAPNPKNSTPRTVNLASYGNGYTNNNLANNPKTGNPNYTIPVRTYNHGSKLGNSLRQMLNNDSQRSYNNNNNNSNSTQQSTRSYTPSSNSNSRSSSGSSSSSGSGSTTSRPTRNGKG